MERKYVFSKDSFSRLNSILKNQAFQYLSEKTVSILRKKIEMVYAINSKIRVKGNYIPLEDMLNAITVSYSTKDLSFSVFVDEEKIIWKDENSMPIYKVGEYITSQEETVTDLNGHWSTPILGKKEDEFYIDKTMDEIEVFIKKDFVQYLQKLIRR